MPDSINKTETARVAPAARPGTRARVVTWSASPRFWVCLGVLVCAAVGLRTAASKLGVVLRKEALPLKRSLQLFDARKLAPDYELDARTFKLEPMSEDMIETLGTRDYLQVYIADRRKPLDDPARVALLFVTYYTGRPDMVPHEPDACYQAAGYDKVGAETVTVPVPGVGAPDGQLPVRVVRFRREDQLSSSGRDEATVIYFFHANGHYALTRNDVRETLSNPFQRTAYYMKVEITFTNAGGTRASPHESQAALGPLLARVLPVLLNDHLDLRAFSPQPAAVSSGNAG